MARRRTPTNTRAEGPRTPPTPPVNPNPRQPIIRYTLEETRQQMTLAEELLVQGYTLNTIKQQLRTQLGITASRAQKIVERVQERWKRDWEAERRSWKRAQIQRLTRDIRQLQGTRNPDGTWATKPNYSALIKAEALLADLQGTREPLHVVADVNVELTETLVAVSAQLDPERLDAYLEAARQRQAIVEATARATGTPALPPMGVDLEKRH